jgi:hypothetical protein
MKRDYVPGMAPRDVVLPHGLADRLRPLRPEFSGATMRMPTADPARRRASIVQSWAQHRRVYTQAKLFENGGDHPLAETRGIR